MTSARARHATPTASGETIVCLAWVYPHCRFAAVYDDDAPATCYDNEAPLNALVRAVAARVRRR